MNSLKFRFFAGKIHRGEITPLRSKKGNDFTYSGYADFNGLAYLKEPGTVFYLCSKAKFLGFLTRDNTIVKTKYNLPKATGSDSWSLGIKIEEPYLYITDSMTFYRTNATENFTSKKTANFEKFKGESTKCRILDFQVIDGQIYYLKEDGELWRLDTKTKTKCKIAETLSYGASTCLMKICEKKEFLCMKITNPINKTGDIRIDLVVVHLQEKYKSGDAIVCKKTLKETEIV